MSSPPPKYSIHSASPSELKDDDIVITGMSGLFPDSHNIKEFSDNLFNKVNMVRAQTRWDFKHPEVSEYSGTIPDLDKFDAQFFMIHYRLADSMDSMPKKLMENAYQAIYDAGLNPIELSGSKLGSFVGTGQSEAEKFCSYSTVGFGIVGCNRAMFSNRISYFLNGRGPSMTIDGACSGSMVALTKAYEAITAGECNSAIVGGCAIHLHPQTYVHYGRLMQINPDGKTKCFDQNADGLSQSEAISVIFLQKYKDAKRVYAKLCFAKSEYTPFDDEITGMPFGPYRPLEVSSNFLKQFYQDAGVSPSQVEYVEAFGTASAECDKSELETIENVFCDKKRQKHVVVGSVTSNMGFSDASSGIAAITKVCIGYQSGVIPGNLHCENPRNDIAALRDGRIKIATDHTPFDRSYVAVNNMSVTGINAHALLKGVYRPKDPKRYVSPIPHLVTVSGRTEPAVKRILDDLKSRPVDPEEIALFHNIHRLRISKHMGRGFSILGINDNQETVSLCEKADYYDEAKRPLWFVYSGMGSQWTGMGTHLMRIPVFAAAVQRCHEVLKPKGVNLIHILTTDDKTIYDNILHSFVGIAAVQIGLTDVLKSIGIVPNKIIGHSVGELGCAYADGCFTAEEMILSAYSRGLVSLQTPFIKGSMAAVGLGFKQIQSLCPPEIEVACHNSSESSTISGPAEAMKTFVDQLTAKSIFAKEVPCSNIAYHSRYIKNAGPGLLKYLGEVIKTAKPRSDKWVSTSVPQDKWEEPLAKYSSAEYHTNNLLSPVLFEETSRLIPPNAVLVEIAPHGLLQAILKRSLPNCAHVPLTRRGHNDNAVYLLEALGKLFIHGYDPDLKSLYPKIEFPVSTETRGLSHLVDWMHTENWNLPLYFKATRRYAASADFFISIYDTEYDYLRGHVLNGAITYPAAGILSCVWDTLAMSLDVQKRELSVQFREVNIFSVPKLDDKTPLKLSVEIHKGSGKFEVTNNKVLIAKGAIIAMTPESPVRENTDNDEVIIAADDVYRMLYERGHDYGGEFRSIHSMNSSLNRSQIQWTGNWITFLDGIIQTYALRMESNAIVQPSYIHEITIDTKKHVNDTVAAGAQGLIEANYFKVDDVSKCGGVIIENMKFIQKSAPKRQEVLLKTLKYVPYFCKDVIDISTALYLFLQVISENIASNGITSLEVCDSKKDSLSSYLSNMTEILKHLKLNLKSVEKSEFLTTLHGTGMPHVIIMNNFALDRKLNEELHQVLPQETYLIILEESSRTNNFYRIVASTMTPKGRMVLAKWRPLPLNQKSATVVTVNSTKDILLLHAIRQKLQNQNKLVVVTLYPPFHGLKDLIKKYRMESQRNKVYLAMVDESNLQSIQGQQLPDFDFAFNVLSKGTWGTELYVPYGDYLTHNSDVILRSPKDGNIDSLQWAEAPVVKSQDKIGVTVHYAGLSYLDAKKATGEALNHLDNMSDYTYGMDFSGMTKNGERVMGLIQSGSAASHIHAEPSMLWPIPAHWSLEDAATVPLAYAHAFYCLAIKTNLHRGMSILVHGAAGGLGQAVISVALAHGCKVFATVSEAKKKRFLRRLFPEIPEKHIGNSRDLTFVDMVMNMTDGKGCDLVISCLKGKLANAPLLCVADYGHMLDTHNLHSSDNFQFGMYSLTRARSYKAIDFSSIFTHEIKKEMKMLQVMISDGIAKGYVRPLTRVSYGWSEAQRAVRLLASSKHRGRVLLHLKGSSPPAQPALKLSDSGSYFVISDDKDTMLAINLMSLLVARGARNIIMHFTQNKILGEGHLKLKIKSWQKIGVIIKISKEKITKSEQVDSYIVSCNKMGNLHGIFLVATSPDSNEETELVSLIECLDEKSKKLSPSLKHFTIITETSNFAQHICLKRSKDGFPAMLLQLNKTEKYNEFGVSNTTSDDSTLVWPGVADAVEKSIYASQTVTVAEPRAIRQTTILEEISKLPGVTLKAGMPDNTLLETLGLDDDCTNNIIKILENKFNISNISKTMVSLLTIAQIKEMQEQLNPSQNKAEAGLDTFISEVDTDELLTNTTHILLPTLVQNSLMREDEFDNTQTYLVMIPGLDGLHSRFLNLSKRLKLPALAMQPGLDHLNETIQETANRFTKVLIKVLKPKDKFYLLGYSSGTLIALEMAAILENQGLEGVVYCVDADPETFPKRLTSWLNISQGEEQLDNTVMMHMYTIMCREDNATIEHKLGELNTWDDKLNMVLKEMHGKVTLSKQYAQNTIEAIHARIDQVRNYNGQHKLKQRPLKSQIVLIKTHSKFGSESIMESYSASSLHVYNTKSDHARVLDDPSCTSIINMHLDKEILDAFEKRNLCNTYLLNADTYVKE